MYVLVVVVVILHVYLCINYAILLLLLLLLFYNNSLPFEGVGVKFIRIFKTNNCQLVYYKDVLELFQVVE